MNDRYAIFTRPLVKLLVEINYAHNLGYFYYILSTFQTNFAII